MREEAMEHERTERPVVAISGASGLIGTALLRELAPDYELVALDVREPAELGGGSVDWIECDLTNEDAVTRAFDGLTARHGARLASFVHLAAHYDFSGEPSPLYEELTVEGTKRVLSRLTDTDTDLECEQFVFSSSLLVMKPAEERETLTEESPTRAEWEYPASKLEAESVVAERCGDDLPSVVLRIAGVYDEKCHSIPIAQQIRRIFEKRPESHLFPGNPSKGQPFLHLDDLVSCVRRVIERRDRLSETASGPQIFLVGEPQIETYGELQDQIGTLLHGTEWATLPIPKPIAKAGAWVKNQIEDDESFIKPWMVDLADAHYPISIARAERDLGWSPSERLRHALPKIVGRLLRDPKAWYEENGLPWSDELEASEEASTSKA